MNTFNPPSTACAKSGGAQFPFGGGKVSTTASFGIAGFHGSDAPAFSALMQQADKALYTAKRAGGNQVKMATAEMVEE